MGNSVYKSSSCFSMYLCKLEYLDRWTEAFVRAQLLTLPLKGHNVVDDVLASVLG